MILVDANVLLYAYDRSSPRHRLARRWFEGALNGDEEIRFALITLLAFLRISTNPAVYRRPLRPSRRSSPARIASLKTALVVRPLRRASRPIAAATSSSSVSVVRVATS